MGKCVRSRPRSVYPRCKRPVGLSVVLIRDKPQAVRLFEHLPSRLSQSCWTPYNAHATAFACFSTGRACPTGMVQP